jgi:hypothetical protein
VPVNHFPKNKLRLYPDHRFLGLRLERYREDRELMEFLRKL